LAGPQPQPLCPTPNLHRRDARLSINGIDVRRRGVDHFIGMGRVAGMTASD